ncbi:hypothetical protein RF11_08220 [Thelohanellus kitauei]|uniref:DDE-1 domain-containing protein n=1 Tax=Thelohanellus kitauei TaxID=669202 RepID=A0A0C2JWL2_THEKT|nr:hypothetical protein RF11_08220 [Thelohanellus kitauei]
MLDYHTHVSKAKRQSIAQFVFYPPNEKTNSKPMDNVIKENLKRHYKKLLLCHRLDVMENGKKFSINLHETLQVVQRAWMLVGKLTNSNCFAKVKFIKEVIRTEAQYAELIRISEALPTEKKMHENGQIFISNCLEVDECLANSVSLPFYEMAKEILCNEEPVES